MNVFLRQNFTGPSPYRAELLREQQVLPAIGNLPRVIRAFVGVR